MKLLRQYFVLLLLLAYTGQALVATGAPCFMMASSSAVMSADMPGMDHSGHTMPGSEQAGAGADCCDGAGFCSISECQSVVAMPIALVHATAAPVSTQVTAQCVSPPSLDISPLYRPPIFA